jgi:NADH-quinone oxidoreductase subunit H
VFAYPQATIDEAANAATVILLGPDLKEELPVLHLRLRDASEKKRSKIVEFGSKESGLTRYAWKHAGHEPGQQVAAVRSTLTETAVVSQLGKGSVVVVVGRANLAESPEFTMSALAAVMELVPNAKVLPVLRRGNVRGALSAGMGAGSAVEILERAAAGKINCLVLVGADPLADFPDADLARRALTSVPNIVSLDTFMTTSSSQAQIVLPAAAFGEKDGTTTNLEGRVSQLSRKVTTRGTSRPDWMVAVELADLLDIDLGVGSVHDVFDQMVNTQSAFRPIDRAAVKASPDGVLLAHVGSAPIASPVPEVPERAGFSYRLVVSRKLYDAGQNVANSPSLASLAPGSAIYLHPLDLDRLGAPAGSNVKAIGARTSVVASWHGVGSLEPARRQGGRTHRRLRARERRATGEHLMARLLALDPVAIGDLLWTPLLIIILKVVAIFAIGLLVTMFMVWFERKAIAGMQNRIGPNKAGPWGLLQTLADGIKLFFKEDLLPDRADRFVFKLAPYLAFVPAFLVWSVIPLGGDFSDGKNGIVTWFGEQTRVQLADPPVGILLVLALSSIAVYGIMLAGWSSGSKYPLLGSVRASAQMVSYEAALGLSIATVLLLAGTLSTSGIVANQDGFANWHVVSTGVVPFIIFLLAATAELNRPPFDLVEAEQELVGGFNTEYSSIRFGLFFLAEFMNTVTMSGIIVTLFWGGPQGLFDIPVVPGAIEGTIWFIAKVLLFLYVYVWFRATLPRFRYDQLMDLGWKILIPMSLGWFMLMAALRLGRDQDWNQAVVAIVSAVVLIVCAGLISMAMKVSRANREREGATF